MSSSTSQPLWKECCNNKLPSRFSTPIPINNHEFILLSRCRGISKYNIISQTWIHKYISYPPKHRIMIDPASAYSKAKNTLYLYDGYKSGTILQINVLTRKVVVIKNKLPKIKNAKLIFIQHKLHLIGGHNDDHFIFDESKQLFTHYRTFDALFGSKGFKSLTLISLRNQNKILIIGHCNNGLQTKESESISSYSLSSSNCTNSNYQQWTTSVIELPLKINRFAYAITKNQQYIILLGGCINSIEIDDIYIIDSHQKDSNPIKSSIKCPKISYDFHATTTMNEMQDEMIVCGYIRYIVIPFLPYYLIRYISTWYVNEYLHLFEANVDPALHWNILIDHLVTK